MREAVVRVRNQIEVLLEQAQIKLTSVVSDLLGQSGRRMLHALIHGLVDPVQLAALGDRRLHASPEQLADALSGRLTEAQRLVLQLYVQQIEQLEKHIADLDAALARALTPHQDAVRRLCEIPGVSVRSAQHMVAEVGPRAAAFASAGKLASWVAICPGQQESAGVSVSSRSAKGNWMMRRTLAQTAWAAVAIKGSEARRRFQAWRPRLGTQKAVWAVAHYQLRIIWKVLHDGVRYQQPDTEALSQRALVARARRAVDQLRKLGYTISLTPPQTPMTPVAT